MTRPGYTDWIPIGLTRHCRVDEDKVEITHPVIFGRGFLFDGARQVVTIRRCLFGLTLSEQEMPFSDVIMRCRKRRLQAREGIPPYVRSRPARTVYFIEIAIAHRKKIKLCDVENGGLAERILAPIEKLGVKCLPRPEL